LENHGANTNNMTNWGNECIMQYPIYPSASHAFRGRLIAHKLGNMLVLNVHVAINLDMTFGGLPLHNPILLGQCFALQIFLYKRNCRQ
jgi:hypothetical protein